MRKFLILTASILTAMTAFLSLRGGEPDFGGVG